MAMNHRLMRPKASGFSPKSISGLAAWYDASSSPSVVIATGVAKWSDLSGNGRDYVQNTTNNQPAYTASAINGRPALTFNGTSHFLQTAATTLNSPITRILVFQFSSAWTIGTQTVCDGINGSTFRVLRDGASTGSFGTNVSAAINGMAWTSWMIMAMQLDTSSGTGGNLRINNAAVATNANIGNSGTGGGLTLGRYGSAGVQYSPIVVAEELDYSRILTASELLTITKYLSSKYGIVIA
jgi:hypothetical protein